MPTYEYRCPQGHDFEVLQRISDEPGADCPECGELLIRRVGLITEVVSLSDGRCGACRREIPGIWS